MQEYEKAITQERDNCITSTGQTNEPA